MSPVFEDYLAESHFCDVWFVCSDRIVPAHKLVLAQLGDWNKKSGTLLEWLESDETFITVDDWSGDQVTQMLIEIYNTETRDLGSETKVLMKCLGIKVEDIKQSEEYYNSDPEEETGKPQLKELDDVFYSDEEETSNSQNLDVPFVIDNAGAKDESKSSDCSIVVTGSSDKNANSNFSDESRSSHPRIDDETDSIVVTNVVKNSKSANFLPNSHSTCPVAKRKLGEDEGKLKAVLPHQCPACNCNLMSHSQVNEKSKLEYICCFVGCNKKFSFTADFVKHMSEHELESKYMNDHDSDEEIRTTSVKLTFNCLYAGCDYKASCKKTLNIHVRENHLGIKKSQMITKDKRTMKCPSCHKNVKVWYYEKYHKKTCGPTRVVYQCDICAKSGFVNSVTLQNHVRSMHSEEKPFTCEHCDKSFARSESLSKHRALHHGVNHKGEIISRKLYSCDHCGKLLTSSTKLVNHIKVIHEGIKNFKCKFCDKSFGSKNNLDLHEGAVHTGKLPYQCYFCNRSFSRKNLLNEHQKSHQRVRKSIENTTPTTSKRVHFDQVQYVTHLDDVDTLQLTDNIENEKSQDQLVVSQQIMEVDEHGVIQEIVNL